MGVLGRYELLTPLHRGQTGEILLARKWGDGGFHQPVVVKRLHPHLADDPYALIQFQDEARVMAQLTHRAFPTILELRCLGGAWFIAMELVAGWRLDEVLDLGAQRGHPVPIAVALGIGLQVCDALAHAHAHDVIHGTISEGNVILTPDGEVRVLDLSAARSPVRRHPREAVRESVGTMAPEQIEGGEIDARADIFAIGALVYRLSTGRAPYSAEDDLELLEAIMEGEPTPPSERRDDYPPELDAVVRSALAADPTERPRSAEIFHRALEGFALREGLHVGPRAVAAYLRSALPPLAPFAELEGEPHPPSFVIGETLDPDEVEMIDSTQFDLDY